MPNFRMLPFFATAVMLLAVPAFADDPALQQNGTSCASASPPPYCSSTVAVSTGTDSATGLTTVEYIFNTTSGSDPVIPDLAADWAGWVEGTVGSTEAELLHFVVSGSQYAVFLYCGGNSADVCAPNDDVLPKYENSNVTSTFAMDTSYYQPDGSATCGSPAKPCGTLPGSGQYFPGSPVGYAILYPAGSGAGGVMGSVITPEPSSVLLLGTMIIALAVFVRRTFSAGA